MTVLIMAGGNGTRWTRETPKQLTALPDGETVIGRMIRQVKDRDSRVFMGCISAHDDVINTAYHYGVLSRPYNIGRCIDETLLDVMTNNATGNDQFVRILLGDTIYSAATMNAIMASDKPLAFFADVGDIYAVTFHRDSIPTLITACKIIIDETYRPGFTVPRSHGKLWHLYRQVAGYDLLTHEPNFDDGLLVRVHDWTCDLDSEDHWNWFADNVLAKGLLDDVVTEVAG